jgi:hypothetical protein
MILSNVVAEELFHALDQPDYIQRLEFSAQDCIALSRQAKRILDIYFDDKFSGFTGSNPNPGVFNMHDFRERMAEVHQNLPDLVATFGKTPDIYNRSTLLVQTRLMSQIANFYKREGYKDIPELWDTDLFAKTASWMALRRHHQRNNDVALERRSEAQLFDTDAGKAVIKVLDTLEAEYNWLPQAERDKAERFAEQAANALEARQPNVSRYERVARHPGSIER